MSQTFIQGISLELRVLISYNDKLLIMFYSFSPNINSNPYNKLNTSSRYLNNTTQLYPATKYLINK